MIDDRTAALRLLLRRGVEPTDVQAQDDVIARRIAARFARGNISLQHGEILTAEDLDRARNARREKIQQTKK